MRLRLILPLLRRPSHRRLDSFREAGSSQPFLVFIKNESCLQYDYTTNYAQKAISTLSRPGVKPLVLFPLFKDSDVARHMSANFSPTGQPCGDGPREWRRFSKFFHEPSSLLTGISLAVVDPSNVVAPSPVSHPSANNTPELEMYKILTQSVARCLQ